MNHADFEQSARSIIENHWRIRAALALFRAAQPTHFDEMRYDGVPQFGNMVGLLAAESVDQALKALLVYSTDRLARDLFVALIASFEARLIARLSAGGSQASGTLGQLQTAVQAIVAVPPDRVHDLNEVRERRNMLMHYDGAAQPRYIAAAQGVAGRAGAFVTVPKVGDMVVPDGQYLTYAASTLVMYSGSL